MPNHPPPRPELLGPALETLPPEHALQLRALAETVVQAYPAAGAVQVVLGDDALISQLNGAYRGKPEPTDVLSFDLRPGPGPQPQGEVDGEVYLSVERAQVQADEQGVPLLQELGRLLTHGLLHLAGHDHPTPDDLRHMEALTDQLLQEAGLLAAPS